MNMPPTHSARAVWFALVHTGTGLEEGGWILGNLARWSPLPFPETPSTGCARLTRSWPCERCNKVRESIETGERRGWF